RAATTDIDEPEEIELGRAVTTALGSRYTLLRDEPLTRYVALVGNAVADQSDRPDLHYYFGVLDTDEINAFAAPGGYVLVTRGTAGKRRARPTAWASSTPRARATIRPDFATFFRPFRRAVSSQRSRGSLRNGRRRIPAPTIG